MNKNLKEINTKTNNRRALQLILQQCHAYNVNATYACLHYGGAYITTQCCDKWITTMPHAVNWITTMPWTTSQCLLTCRQLNYNNAMDNKSMPWTQVNACLHYGGAYINDNWIELQQCHGRQVNACSAIALLVPTYYNNAICLHTYITMPYAYTLIYSFPAWKKAFQHIYSFPQKTATMSETYR